jgi:hypothetical protein
LNFGIFDPKHFPELVARAGPVENSEILKFEIGQRLISSKFKFDNFLRGGEVGFLLI